MSKNSHVTITDVAEKAGVSVSTVSRILNGKQDVAVATRDRVQQVIAELGFRPHVQAKRLRGGGKTHSLALLFPLAHGGNISYNALETDFIVGASVAANEGGYFFNLMTAPVTDGDLLDLFRGGQIDGAVLMQIHARDSRVEFLRTNDHPFVMIGRTADNTGLSYVDLDFEDAVIAAFNYAVSLGHRRIGFLALPHGLNVHGYGPAMRGWQGYQKSLAAHGLAPIFREVAYDAQAMLDATLSMLDEAPDLSAIVTTHEYAPLNIIQALTVRRRRIPQDCSIIGLMTEKIARLSTPPITHIEFPSYRMGYDAVRILIRQLESDSFTPEQVLIPPRLLLGKSTTEAT
ncbi:MAG: LacI family DNA-binding transcriptional regulator [Anaerolineae bacterium]